jgi:hypothetical protein
LDRDIWSFSIAKPDTKTGVTSAKKGINSGMKIGGKNESISDYP